MLKNLLVFAAQVSLHEDLPHGETSKLFGLSLRDLLLLLGVVAIIGLSLFLWAYLTRRKHRRHLARVPGVIGQSERHSHRRGSEGRMRVRKRRRDHPDNLPRNPTLGETGGLPPIRPDEPAQPVA